MTKNNNQIDELFRSKLEHFEQEPPAYVWNRIREQQVGDKRRVLFRYLKGTGVAAAVLLAFFLGWQMQHRDGELAPVLSDRQVPASEQEINTTPGDSERETEPETGIAIPQEPAEPVYAQEVAKPNVPVDRETGGVEKNELNSAATPAFVSGADLFAQENASATEALIRSTEDAKSLRLLDLLKLELDDSFDQQTALVEMNKKQRENASELNLLDQYRMQENARMLAMNQQAGEEQGWTLGAMLTPGMAVNQGSQSQSYSRNMTVANSKDHFQMGGGLAVEYKTKKRWSIQSGVYYSKLEQTSSNQVFQPAGISNDVVSGESAKGDPAYFNTTVAVRAGEMLMNTAAGVISIDRLPTNAKLSNGFESFAASDGILLTETEFEQNFEYIEIPFLLRYQLIDAAFDLQVLGGFSTSVLVGNNAYANSQFGNERIGETRDMNRFNYSTTIGLGLGYGISNKISLRVEPQLRYFLGSLNSNPDVDFKPYTIGVGTGLSYRF